MLRKVAGLPEDALENCFAALDRAELLVRADSELEDLLEFRHEMVRQVTYDSMIGKVREGMHARILEVLEGDSTWSDGPDALCYHATRAKEWLNCEEYREPRKIRHRTAKTNMILVEGV